MRIHNLFIYNFDRQKLLAMTITNFHFISDNISIVQAGGRQYDRAGR